MHELSVCQALIAQVEDIAARHGAVGVKTVKLRIGPLSGIEKTLLEHAYPLASAGTLGEHASLEIRMSPVRVRCQTCGEETEASLNQLLCGACGDFHTQLVSGDELLLESVELITSENTV
jgi:hydrogenase nickel incorporation protein HypA/HybF